SQCGLCQPSTFVFLNGDCFCVESRFNPKCRPVVVEVFYNFHTRWISGHVLCKFEVRQRRYSLVGMKMQTLIMISPWSSNLICFLNKNKILIQLSQGRGTCQARYAGPNDEDIR